MAPKCFPESPFFDDAAEAAVFQALISELPDQAEIFCNYRFFDGNQSREIDFLILWPGQGIIFLEVKGGNLHLDKDGKWRQGHGAIDPYKQVTESMYSLTEMVENRWSRGFKPRATWLVVFPFFELEKTIETFTLPRNRIVSKDEMFDIAEIIRKHLHNLENATNSRVDLDAFSATINNLHSPEELIQAQWKNFDNYRTVLTEGQSAILNCLRFLPSYAITGPAGSGKTFLAIEQARRHVAAGRKTALICYNHGLARFLKRSTASWPDETRPAFVGTFHDLLIDVWKINVPAKTDTEFWTTTAPRLANENLQKKKGLTRFEAFVVDEAQDFHFEWWATLSLGTDLSSAESFFNAFGDVDQQIFKDSEFHANRFSFPRIAIDENLRSTAPIVELASVLMGTEINHRGIPGETVKFVQCETSEAQKAADVVLDLLTEGFYGPKDVLLLTTNHRHPLQVEISQNGRNKKAYWDHYFDEADYFYSNVYSFKGLERRVVVVAMDGWKREDQAREILYVAMTRARDALVLVGDINEIEETLGKSFADELRKLQVMTYSEDELLITDTD